MDPSSAVFQEDATVTIEGKDVPINLTLSEPGNIVVDVVSSPKYDLFGETGFHKKSVQGTTASGDTVECSNISVSLGMKAESGKKSYNYINEINAVSEITINGTNNYVSYAGEEVTISFDVLGLRHYVPHSVVDEFELINKPDLKVVATPVNDIDERIEYIKSHKSLIRTAEVKITLDIAGDIAHQVVTAVDSLSDVLSLCGFVQGIGPNYVKAELDSIDDQPAHSYQGGLRFTQLYSTQGDIGGSLASGRLAWGNDLCTYLGEAFDNYDNTVKNNLRVRQVLGYYWDAMNATRPVEGRLLSVCSGIELLAKRYSDLYNQQARTQDRIEYLIDELDVETDDLASFAGTTSKSASKKYFYSYSRHYVVHGDNNPSSDELISDFNAALTLLQRIIRNQLVGSMDMSQFSSLNDITPSETISFV
jgi:hypothetical protein